MKIVEVETIPLAIPFTHGGKPAGWGGKAWTSLSILLVKVTTEEGVTGYGEAFSYNCLRSVQAALDDMVAPIVVNQEVDDIGIFLREVQQKLHLFGRYGIVMFALSGLDIALWDIAAKTVNMPLWQLLDERSGIVVKDHVHASQATGGRIFLLPIKRDSGVCLVPNLQQ